MSISGEANRREQNKGGKEVSWPGRKGQGGLGFHLLKRRGKDPVTGEEIHGNLWRPG